MSLNCSYPIAIQFMSTMSEHHRWMDELRQEDFEILADLAYRQEKAMREELDLENHATNLNPDQRI